MLDFSVLDNDLPKGPTGPANKAAHINIPAELKTQPAGLIGPIAEEKRKKEHERSLLELGKLINERLGHCQLAIWAYNKAVRDGRPPEEIALLAARALSLAVSEELIYTSLEGRYREAYGISTEPSPPYSIIRTAK